MKEDGGNEEKSNEKSRGEKAGTPECRLRCVHISDPGVKLSFFHGHSQTGLGHEQPTYKVLCPVTHLHNWMLELDNEQRVKREYKINVIPNPRIEGGNEVSLAQFASANSLLLHPQSVMGHLDINLYR